MLQVGRMLVGGVGTRGQRNPMQAVFCIVLGMQGILHSYQAGAFMARYCSMQYQTSAPFPSTSHNADAQRQQTQNAGDAGPHLGSMPEQANATSPITADRSPINHASNQASVSSDATCIAEQAEGGQSPYSAAVGVSIILLSSTAALFALAAFGFSAMYDDWPGVLLAAALAPLGAAGRWQMGRWNKLPESMHPVKLRRVWYVASCTRSNL